MNEETKTLFRTLTQLPGAPGNEHQVPLLYETGACEICG